MKTHPPDNNHYFEVPGIHFSYSLMDRKFLYLNQEGMDFFGLKSSSDEQIIDIKSIIRFSDLKKILLNINEQNRKDFISCSFYLKSAEGNWVPTFSQFKLHMNSFKHKIIEGISHPLSGKILNASIIKSELLKDYNTKGKDELFYLLSNREKEILSGICDGNSSIKIAESLGIQPSTVDTHRKNIKKKLKVKTSVELYKYYLML